VSRPRGEPGTITDQIWRDPARPAAERVADLLGRMTVTEKVAQLGSLWLGDQPRDANVAPMQGEMSPALQPLAELIRDGLGQVTRVGVRYPAAACGRGARQAARPWSGRSAPATSAAGCHR
jgi:beta-xylosidase